MGLPLFVGFIIKLNYLTLLADQNQMVLIAVILIASLIEGIYFVRLLVKLWYKDEGKVEVKYHLALKVVFVLIAVGLIVFGTFSNPLNELDSDIDQIEEVVQNG